MSYSQITRITAHRPWPLPSGPWIMRQRWHNLLFAHWPVPVEAMRALVPPQLQLDTYEGMAWVGVVPFGMSDVAPRRVPAMPWLSAFPELNVRTYVTAPAPLGADPTVSKPGVYFFSLDAANPIAVTAARKVFKLPYYQATMRLTKQGDHVNYMSHRTHRDAPPADLEASYAPTGDVYTSRWGSRDHWMTERYCLYTTSREQLYRAEIHHVPWPLQPATAEFSINTMAAAAGISLPPHEPILHFARRQDVIVWPLTKVH